MLTKEDIKTHAIALAQDLISKIEYESDVDNINIIESLLCDASNLLSEGPSTRYASEFYNSEGDI